jgi:hypothetical protein
MHGLKAAMSKPLDNTHFLTFMVDRAGGMVLSFLWNTTVPIGSRPAGIHLAHVGIRRQQFSRAKPCLRCDTLYLDMESQRGQE